jgi:hypothetical protein
MRFGVAFLLLSLTAFPAPVTADEVDDLLVSRKVEHPKAPSEVLWSGPPVQEDAALPLQVLPLAEPAPWEGAVVANSAEPAVTPDSAPRDPTRDSRVNLVPEPSAIALAVLALVYFLVFFRRRHFA